MKLDPNHQLFNDKNKAIVFQHPNWCHLFLTYAGIQATFHNLWHFLWLRIPWLIIEGLLLIGFPIWFLPINFGLIILLIIGNLIVATYIVIKLLLSHFPK